MRRDEPSANGPSTPDPLGEPSANGPSTPDPLGEPASAMAGPGHPPATVATWRPQRFGRGDARRVVDPLVEPLWDGLRVLAVLGLDEPRPRAEASVAGSPADANAAPGARVTIVDERGNRVEGHPDVETAIARAAEAAGSRCLVLDGYLTGQATRSAEGLRAADAEVPGMGEIAAQLLIGSAGRGRRQELARVREVVATAGPLAFVAVDLLLVDDVPLLDIPLLERKRVLETSVIEGDRVRRTVWIRLPLEPWLGSWRSLGFGSVAYKGANSRYRPGEVNRDWAIARIPRR